MPSLRAPVSTLALLALGGAAAASDALIKPGREYVVIDSPHLHVLVPKEDVELLKPFVARAEIIYTHMAKDAGYEIREPLTIMMNDDAEDHNGFSTTVPFPIVDIDMAPATQPSFIYDGGDYLERTLTHELTHHFSNDREPNPFRRVMSDIFGRVLPNDLLSLVWAYLTIPAHTTSPSFWHEGCAQWSETTYAPAGTPWGGRGRDPLTHMVWRLDAASPKGLPEVADWRITYQKWPFGTRTYLYGMAYLRYLSAAYGDRASVWAMIERQEHRWPFCFNGGPEPLLGKDHLTMIAEARAALLQEQQAQLRILQSQPVTASRRLTPEDSTVSAPAWTKDGELFAAYNDAYDRPYFSRIGRHEDGSGTVHRTWYSSWAMGEARSLPDGTLVFNETPADTSPWAQNRIYIISPEGWPHRLPGKRLLQPDARHVDGDPAKYQVAAIRLLPAARQELVVAQVRFGHWWNPIADFTDWKAVAVQGIPWSPSYRPGHDELSWVESDEKGSRLVLAPIADPSQRTVLAEVRGRILHPAWTADGARVFICADHTGVANAWCIDAAKPGTLIPVTNTIGGILACVPKPGGGELAIIDHDIHGPYLARIPDDPTFWPKEVPSLTLAFPAPLGAGRESRYVQADAPAADAPAADGAAGGDGVARPDVAPRLARDLPQYSLPDDAGDQSQLKTHPYHGLLEIRPLYWAPTTLVVPEGGYGAFGVATDKLLTHELIASVGGGPVDPHGVVGLVGYTYGGWPLDIQALGWRSQRFFDGVIQDSLGHRYSYADTVKDAELRTGYGLEGLRRRTQLYVGAGVANYEPIVRVTDQSKGIPPPRPPLTGDERYIETTAAYDDATFFPTSYTSEDGDTIAAIWRHSWYENDLSADRVLGRATKIITVWPSQSHQIVVGGEVGWSRGDRFLQGEFVVGGASGAALPRGYPDAIAVGNYLLAGSAAYRAPVWRPFDGFSTSPFVFRQIVVEAFVDTAKVSPNRINGQGSWYRSVGGELHAQWEFWYTLVDPGLGVAKQLDGDGNTVAYLTLAYGW
jgi:hypothetical protein